MFLQGAMSSKSEAPQTQPTLQQGTTSTQALAASTQPQLPSDQERLSVEYDNSSKNWGEYM
jgi:hypothetical protein